MKDLNLIDIEESIYKKLKTTCDMNQEAIEYLNSNLNNLASFGLEEESAIISSGEKTISDINSFPLISAIPLINRIIDVFGKTNLGSLKTTSFAAVFPFHYPLKQHEKNILKTENLYSEFLNQREDYILATNFFNSLQKEQILLLEKIDKSILLGKCIHHQLSDNPEKYIKELTTLQERIFQMEITKNIPLQIISKIQGLIDIINNILELIDKNLSPDFSLYISNYKSVVNRLKDRKEIERPERLHFLYQNILRDIKNLEIIDEDLEEKSQDLKKAGSLI
ncbi:MAG: hypothetical protein PHH19_07160 [Eubacteriales bacterium]|nr:hypothetical protein [Eubacteriales bacterium]